MKKRFLTLLTLIFLTSLACSAPAWAPAPSPTALPIPTQTGTDLPVLSSPTRTPTQAPAVHKATVSALRALNVREGPRKESAGIGVLLAGDLVTLTGRCSGGWSQVFYEVKGETVRAWVNSRYITDGCKEE